MCIKNAVHYKTTCVCVFHNTVEEMWVKPSIGRKLFPPLGMCEYFSPRALIGTKGKLLQQRKWMRWKSKSKKRVELSCTTPLHQQHHRERARRKSLGNRLSNLRGAKRRKYRDGRPSIGHAFFVCWSVMFETSWNFPSNTCTQKDDASSSSVNRRF